MYQIMKGISVLARLFIVPNPFEGIEGGFVINAVVVEPMLHIVTFFLVGIVYQRGKAPTLGSFLYLAVYWGIVLLIKGIV